MYFIKAFWLYFEATKFGKTFIGVLPLHYRYAMGNRTPTPGLTSM
jgi:hypothetical protein